jgi:hypothetical protein
VVAFGPAFAHSFHRSLVFEGGRKMKASRTALIGAVASAALLGTAAAGFAQSPTSQQGRVITVPPGAVVLVLPAGAVAAPAFDTGFGFPDMPSPVAMIRQMDQMMADMQRSFASFDPNRTIEAAMGGPPPAAGPVAGVVVTSFSDGHGTCTQRITYKGDGSAPVVQVASTGDACASAGLPAATPAVQTPTLPTPAHPGPHLIQVRDNTRPAAPLVYAQAAQ